MLSSESDPGSGSGKGSGRGCCGEKSEFIDRCPSMAWPMAVECVESLDGLGFGLDSFLDQKIENKFGN